MKKHRPTSSRILSWAPLPEEKLARPSGARPNTTPLSTGFTWRKLSESPAPVVGSTAWCSISS
jgi:hypothetical protein